ncbi:sodium-dependent transporter [Paenibacillus albiflavus]|uniref:Transporter n=1 Tax=Paenibacillus albiflavus TaxID=2545760 RepID=A0A4R4EAE8_9BACL|nr:sodium-dependent transporter [Paenibacillus albiflavus]TCZ75880.1 sodium-dependent transporter [Paenibacillus albiflavus]
MKQEQQWSSKIGFILAAAGSAIGLGAIWKFPYVMATSGGGAFFLIFLLFTIFIGLPLLLAELIIGRSTGKDAIRAYKTIAPTGYWHLLGYLGTATSFIIFSFYSVIGGWILLYFGRSLTGSLLHHNLVFSDLFKEITANPLAVTSAQLLFILITIYVVAKGVSTGIEKASQFMMPALFILFLVLVVRSLTLEGASEGVRYFLMPDFNKLTKDAVIYAMGQSFFCLSIGVSVMVTYSSYLDKRETLTKSSISIVSLNLLTTILAGFAIFPAVFSFGMEPTAGPGLLFVVLPSIFEQMAFGSVFLVIFMALFLFATLSSAFSLLEIIVAVIVKGDASKRKKYSWIVGFCVFLVGIPCSLSFGPMSDMTLFGKTFFDLADYLASYILLPIGVFLISIFVGYRFPRARLVEELCKESAWWRKGTVYYVMLLRYIIPIVVIIVFLNIFGVL